MGKYRFIQRSVCECVYVSLPSGPPEERSDSSVLCNSLPQGVERDGGPEWSHRTLVIEALQMYRLRSLLSLSLRLPCSKAESGAAVKSPDRPFSRPLTGRVMTPETC